MIERIILDLNSILYYIEDILKKYIPNTEFHKYYSDDLLYCKSYRFPITNRSGELDKKNISNKPFYAIAAAFLLRKLALLQILDENPNRSAIFKNELLNNTTSNIYNINPYTDIADIYQEMFPDITIIDCGKIEHLIQPAIDKILNVIKKNPEAVYSIDIDTKFIIVLRHEHILAYRYREALDFKQIADAIELEHQEVCNVYNNR